VTTNSPTDDIWEVLETCRAIRYLKPDPVAPELTLDQIRLKSAVLKFKGYRYQIGY